MTSSSLTEFSTRSTHSLCIYDSRTSCRLSRHTTGVSTQRLSEVVDNVDGWNLFTALDRSNVAVAVGDDNTIIETRY